jgi:hypothetical protein
MLLRSSVPEPARIEPTLQTESDLTQWARAVVQDGRGLMVWRHDAPALIAISEALQAHWQAQAPQLAMAHFSGHQPAGLLGRINESLTQQGLQQAMASGPNPEPHSIWFVHDAECFSEDELLLLLRLNEHFPGLKIRWVLLFNMALPLPQGKQALLDKAPGRWLQWTAPSPARALALRPEPLTPALVGVAKSLRSSSVELWGLGLVVLLGLGVWLLLHNTTQDKTGSPQRTTAQATPHPAPDQTRLQGNGAIGQNTVSGQKVESASDATLNPDLRPPMNTTPSPVQGAPLNGQPAINPPPTEMGRVLERSGLPSEVASDLRSRPQTPPPPPMPEVAQLGLRWLKTLPQDSLLLEHGVFETAQQAQRLLRVQNELNSARVVMLKATATEPTRFIVVTGPFRSEERARNFRARKRLPEQTRIEEVGRVLQKSAVPINRPRQN